MIPVGGLTPLSTIDWPERLAAVLYLRGCPWRCPYCHNPEFQRVPGPVHAWAGIETFLEERRGFLDGVVFSGGEPTLHAGLPAALEHVRSLGFGTALHTGGNYPGRLRELLDRGLVDWVGFDVKAPFSDYELVTQSPGSGARSRRSLEILTASGVAFEMRTTVYTPVLTDARMQTLALDVGGLTPGPLVLQRCIEAAS